MKRMIALILCLMMVLGLFTGVVGADETEIGTLYACTSANWTEIDNTVTLTNKTDLAGAESYTFWYLDGTVPTQITNLSILSIVDSKGKTLSEVRYDDNLQCELGAIIRGTGSNGAPEGFFMWDRHVAYPNRTGYLRATVGDQIYQLAMSTAMPAVGMTDTIPWTAESYLPSTAQIPYTPGTAKTVYLFSEYPIATDSAHAPYFEGHDAITFGDVFKESNVYYLPITLSSDATDNNCGIDAYMHYSIDVDQIAMFNRWFSFVKDTGNQGGDGGGGESGPVFALGTLTQEKSEVQDEAEYFAADGLCLDGYFDYEKGGITTRYYLLLNGWNNDSNDWRPFHTGSTNIVDSTTEIVYTGGFYFINATGQFEAVSPEMSQELAGLFDSFTIYTRPTREDDNQPCTHYPNVYNATVEGFPAAAVVELDKDCLGVQRIMLEGKLKNNGGTVLTHSRLEVYRNLPPIIRQADSIEIANMILGGLSETGTSMEQQVVILFDQANQPLEGFLTIPENVENVKLIGGAYDDNGNFMPNSHTLWNGGVIAEEGYWREITGFLMVGAGKEQEIWPDTDRPNYAMSGTAGFRYSNCIFTGYDHVGHTNNIKTFTFGGNDSLFIDNNVGLYLTFKNTNGGHGVMTNCDFIGNGTAIQFGSITNNSLISMSSFSVLDSHFINNGVDVDNQSGQLLNMPGCYYYHDDNGNYEKKLNPEIEGTFAAKYVGNKNGYHQHKTKNIPSALTAPYLYYPMKDFTEVANYEMLEAFFLDFFDVEIEIGDHLENFLEDDLPVITAEENPEYYYPNHYYTTNQIQRDYPNANGKATDIAEVLSDDKWIGSQELVEALDTADAPAPAMFRLLMRNVRPEELTGLPHDASMGRRDTDSEIQIFLPPLPEGYTVNVSTPNRDEWLEVDVFYGDSELPDVSINEDDLVVFQARSLQEEARYDIRPAVSIKTETEKDSVTATVTGDPTQSHDITVEVPEDWKEETIIVTAPDGTETEVKASEDGTVTFDVDQEGEYTLEKKKSGLSGLIGAIVGALGGIGSDMDFADVAKDAWYYDDVAWAYSEGLMDGTGNGKFSPDMATSRAMIVTILWRLEGCPMGVEESSFSDVQADSWYGYAVDWAAAFGIVEGYDGKFAPNDAITREQLAAILYRYAQYKGYDVVNTQTGLNGFTDAAKVSDWALAPMQWAVGNGLINGINDALNCGGTATRAQTAAILHRFFG